MQKSYHSLEHFQMNTQISTRACIKAHAGVCISFKVANFIVPQTRGPTPVPAPLGGDFPGCELVHEKLHPAAPCLLSPVRLLPFLQDWDGLFGSALSLRRFLFISPYHSSMWGGSFLVSFLMKVFSPGIKFQQRPSPWAKFGGHNVFFISMFG